MGYDLDTFCRKSRFLLIALPLCLGLIFSGCKNSDQNIADGNAGVSSDKAEAVPVVRIVTGGEIEGILSTGKVSNIKNIAMARQVAANRARHNLIKFINEKGYTQDKQDVITGMTIRRYYTENGVVYAEGFIPMDSINVNVDPEKSSNNSEIKQELEKERKKTN